MRIEGVKEEEADKETWDKCKEKCSILKSKLKINNLKIERTDIVPRRKRSHNKEKPRKIVFKLHPYEDKDSIMRNVYRLKNTGYYINEDVSKATLNIRVELWDEVKRLRGVGYYAVVKYDRIVTNKREEVISNTAVVVKQEIAEQTNGTKWLLMI